MAGLLDARGGFDDPITMGLLGASQALLTPVSQGGGLGAAFGAFPAAQQAAEQRRMRELLQMAQMSNMQSETEYRNAQMAASREEAMRKAQAEAGRSALFGEIAAQGMPTFRDASAAITGVNPTADYVSPQNRRPSLTPQLAARAAVLGIKPEELTAVFDAGRPEVARTIESRGPDGSPQTMQFDKYGQPIGAGIGKAFEFRSVDLGNRVESQNPYQQFSFLKGQTPDSVASNRVAQDRLNFDMRGKPQYDPERGIFVDPVTKEAIPVTLNGEPVGLKNKDPNEGQSNAFLYANRATAANNAIADLEGSASINAAGTAQGLAGVPLIGGALGAGANFALSPSTQRYLQAQRDFINAVLRKESGAAIGKDEFDNARQQYFPQPGDSNEVKQQKANNRALAIQGITAGAGPLASRVMPSTAGGQPDALGAVVPPVSQAKISSDFGPRTAPKAGASTNHGGVDYAVPVGTAVASSAPGRVSAVGNEPGGYGNYVTVTHPGGYQTTYAHLGDSKVKLGDSVAGGQIIALSGNSGNSTGPHLHFAVKQNGAVIDPNKFLSGAASNAKRGIGTQQVSGQIGNAGSLARTADSDPLGLFPR